MDGLPGLMLYSVLGGVTTGLCVPNIISKFLNSTTFENRGSACGILIFFVYVVVFISAAFIASYVQLALFFLSFKVLALMLLTSKSVLSSKKEELAFLYQPRLVVYLYLFVWFLFLLVDIIVSNIASQRFSRAEIEIINLESVLLGLFTMIIGGALMDNVGRRKLITLAFLYLGVEYSFISLSSGELIRYTFIDGVAWGIITTVFMFVLWGDAIKPGERHLFSAFSMIVALASIYFKNALSILGFRLDFTQTFPLTSIFLFLSVIITSFYLPETLPEKVIQSKELRNYIETAKKIKEKYK
ncbi:MAG: hypothetical protein QFX35_03195 [Candidatus Verstraetearchaeota archaeon]|nr:hypothetical protein [Candidatus Verstraetearchaeota archaeon]